MDKIKQAQIEERAEQSLITILELIEREIAKGEGCDAKHLNKLISSFNALKSWY